MRIREADLYTKWLDIATDRYRRDVSPFSLK